MLLLASRPAAGPHPSILGPVRRALAQGASDFRLLVPTATLAEHLRHELARERGFLRPRLVVTLSQFLEPWTGDLPEVSQATLELVVQAALERTDPQEFRQAAQLPGFRRLLAELIDEFSTAGCDRRRLAEALADQPVEAPLARAFLAVYQEVESELERRGWALRAGVLARAAREIRARGLPGVRQVFLDGFFSFSEPELALIDALRQHADLTVTLPPWAGSEAARAALVGMGFLEETAPASEDAPTVTVIAAVNLEQEVEEICRRILEQVERGRQFREIGIVLRTGEPYVPILRTTLERFGIPGRFYFAAPLVQHSMARYLAGVIEAMLGGWDYAATLAVLKMTASGFGGTPACDQFDFAVRARLPGQGLAGLRGLLQDPRLEALLDRFAALEDWRGWRLPGCGWARQAQALRSLVEPPPIADGCSQETAGLWRSQAAALEALEAALEETSAVLGDQQPLPFTEFWQAAKVVLQETRLRVPDRRRNVVHVMDVFEARQWALPVVFICGLLEKQFPLYHPQDAIFPDAARERLRAAGLRLATTTERRHQEKLLFELATRQATSELVLSFPECNAKGEPNLRSFFLEGLAVQPVKARSARPSGPAPRRLEHAVIRSPELLERIRALRSILRPTGIEDFLQCPFLFFAEHSLGLAEPPVRPDERLDALVQGRIVHQVLAEWQRTAQPLDAVFEGVFARICTDERVPANCRTELARLRMFEDLRRFTADPPVLPGWSVHIEEEIRFDLDPETGIRGRIDRYDVSPAGAAVVFDFKYSSPQGIRDRIRGYDQGQHVQGALYLLGLDVGHGYQPAGWFYWGLRRELSTGGWHLPLAGFERAGAGCTAEELRERLARARQSSLDAARQIREGRIEAAPADPDKCQYCAFRDVCRVRAAGMALAAAGGAP
jgi:hypothetical protein